MTKYQVSLHNPNPAYFCDPLLQAFDLLDHPFANQNNQKVQSSTPINLSETAHSYKIAAEVPGFNKDEITLDVMDRTLTIKGEHKEDSVLEADETHLRVEKHRTLKFERTIRLPAQVDATKVKATLNHGILEVNVGKMTSSVGGRVPILIQ